MPRYAPLSPFVPLVLLDVRTACGLASASQLSRQRPAPDSEREEWLRELKDELAQIMPASDEPAAGASGPALTGAFNDNHGNKNSNNVHYNYHFHYHLQEHKSTRNNANNHNHLRHGRGQGGSSGTRFEEFNTSDELSRYIERIQSVNEHLATLPNEADSVCRERVVAKCSTLDGDGLVPIRNHAKAGHKPIDAMTRACAGETWDGPACLQAFQAYRDESLQHMQEFTATVDEWESFAGIQQMCAASPVRNFRRGGGFAAEVPCGKGGASTPVYYRHIYHTWGQAIKDNLASAAGTPASLNVDQDWIMNHRCTELSKRRSNSTGARPVLFTFVRNPIDRFVLGYMEMTRGGLVGHLRGSKPGSEEHATAFVDLVVHGNCDNGNVLIQAHQLIGNECESRFDFVGKVEHMKRDWHRLSVVAGCDQDIDFQVPEDLKQHDRENGAGGAMRAVLEKNGGALMRLLCWWSMPDFVLFDYELPDACKTDHKLMQAFAKR